MNDRQKEVQQSALDNEKRVIAELKKTYKQAAKDCEEKIAALNARTDMQNLQSIIYQKQYQEALKAQIDGILDVLQGSEFDSVASYLTQCYENGYVGAMYDLQGQGIPIISPIDQSAVAKAVQTDSKISANLYTRLGEDVDGLKTSIRSELSRGVANGSTWFEIAKNIASGMNSPLETAKNNAIRIARTEGHRIQQESALDALDEAAENGADVVKQWDATLDGRTRPEHQKADGQIRELDEYFDVGGEKMKAPGVGGSARNVCNCRCCMLHRARWALDEDELKTLQSRAKYFGLDKTQNFEEYKQKYLKAVANGAESGIIEAEINAGKIKLDVNADKQNRHIPSSNSYIAGRSYIYGSLDNAQKLISELSGTGELVMSSNGWTHKERVQSSKVIGVHISTSGEEKATNKALIVYSKTGTHIIPR